MAFINDLAYDAALDWIIAEGEQLVLCDGEPLTYANATTDAPGGDALGEVALVGGDYTKAAGDASGRKVTIAQKTGINIDASGNWSHWAIIDVTGTRLVATGVMDQTRAVSAGGTATSNAFDIEFTDAT